MAADQACARTAAQHVADRPHEVLRDDVVLTRLHTERGVLVRDPRQQVIGQVRRVRHEVAREGGDRPGQGLLLPAVGLVAAVEDPVEQLRMLLEQVLVEASSDLPDVLPLLLDLLLDLAPLRGMVQFQ